jgi:hypothetical protein
MSDAAAASAAAEAAAAAIANMHSMAAQNTNHYSRNRNRHPGSSAISSAGSSSNSIATPYVGPNTASAASSAHQHLISIAALHSSLYDPDKPNFDVNYRPTEVPAPSSSSVGPPASNRRKNKQRESLRALMQQAFGIMSSPLLAQARPLLINSLTNVAGQFLGSNPAIGSGLSGASSSSSSSSSSSGSSSSIGASGSAASLISSLLPQTQLSRVWANVRHAVLRRNEQPAKHSKKKGKLNSALTSAATAPAPTATVQLLNMLSNMRLLFPTLRVPASISSSSPSSSSSSSSSSLSSPVAFLASALTASGSNRKPFSSSSASSSSSSSLSATSWPRLLLLLARPSSLKQEARTAKHI